MQKFNKKFRLLKPVRFNRKAKKFLTPRQLILKGNKVLRRRHFIIIAKGKLKTPLKNILLHLAVHSKFKKILKKITTPVKILKKITTPVKILKKITTPASRTAEEGMFYQLCNRAAESTNLDNMSKKAWVNLYARAYASLYRTKQITIVVKPVVEQMSISTPVIEPAITKVEPRMSSKNWIVPEIWKTMSNSEKHKFRIKTGKLKHSRKHAK